MFAEAFMPVVMRISGKGFPAKADKKGLEALIQYCHQLIDILKDDESRYNFKLKCVRI